jgi:hypothetical protein
MASIRTVMVSSTARDLPAHRDQVMHACLARQALPIMMEHLPATTADARRTSTEMVDRAEVYLGIFAHRYGYVPSDGDISLTEMEYERAVERGIPRLIFLMADDHPITVADVEKGPGAAKLDALKERLKTEHCVRFFSSPADLRAHVLNTLASLDSAPAAPGATSDLTISSLRGGRRLRPLSGHPVLTPDGPDAPVYTGGVHVSFTLAHNGVGTRSINLHAMVLQVVSFMPGSQAALAYVVEGAAVVGAGVARPQVFSVALRGRTVSPARWVLDRTTNAVSQARSENFLDTEDPRVLTFPAGANDIEELQGTVTAREPGLYAVRFVFHYSVGGEDREHVSDTIRIYAEG